MQTVTVPKESALPADCPLRRPAAMEAYKVAVKAGSKLSIESREVLAPMRPDEMGRWLGSVMDHSRVVFQPWSMEILFVTGVLGDARFGALETVLGASSHTLATKLKALCQAGLLERRVEAGPPTRTSYRLTKAGRATVALAAPLFAHMNLAALGLAP